MDIRLSRSELERFQQYADAEGITVEEAVSRAVTAEIHRRYRLPAAPANVVPIRPLQFPRSSE